MTFTSMSSLMRRHEVFRTNSPDKALHCMARFGAKLFSPLPGKQFAFKLDGIQLENVDLGLAHHGAGLKVGYDTNEDFWQTFVVNGNCVMESCGSSVALDSRNWSALIQPGHYFETTAGPDYQRLTVKIKASAIRDVMSALIGKEDLSLSIEQQGSVNSPMLQSMRRSTFFLASELDAVEPICSAITLREFEQSLILSFLMGHRHNHTSALLQDPPAPSLSQLEMIEDYIESNWDKSLDIRTLATISNVSARSIFRYFRERRGSSPHQFIRRVRLERARAMLMADENPSVIAVALKAGFSSLGHFARNYYTLFGEKPSETAKRAREKSFVARRRPTV